MLQNIALSQFRQETFVVSDDYQLEVALRFALVDNASEHRCK